MSRHPVTSSTIRSLGHEGAIMEVEFRNLSVYRYEQVAANTFTSILTAESVGEAFDAIIKKNPQQYPFRKILG